MLFIEVAECLQMYYNYYNYVTKSVYDYVVTQRDYVTRRYFVSCLSPFFIQQHVSGRYQNRYSILHPPCTEMYICVACDEDVMKFTMQS